MLCYALIKYYSDPLESMRLTTLIQCLSLSSVICYTTLIPFDVYTAVNHTNSAPILGLVSIYDLYLALNYTMLGLVLIALPWSFFYAEEALEGNVQENEDDVEFDSEAGTFSTSKPKGNVEKEGCCVSIQNSIVSFVAKSAKATKSTLYYVAFVVFLGLFSFILSKTKFADDNGHIDSEQLLNQWKKQVMD